LTKGNLELILSQSGKRLRSAYEVFRRFLLDRKISFVKANSGMFVFAKLCPGNSLKSEKIFGQYLKQHCVVLSSGISYHFKNPGWYRVYYTVPLSILKEGLARIDSSIQAFNRRYADQ